MIQNSCHGATQEATKKKSERQFSELKDKTNEQKYLSKGTETFKKNQTEIWELKHSVNEI